MRLFHSNVEVNQGIETLSGQYEHRKKAILEKKRQTQVTSKMLARLVIDNVIYRMSGMTPHSSLLSVMGW
jgi:hypothetical protein